MPRIINERSSDRAFHLWSTYTHRTPAFLETIAGEQLARPSLTRDQVPLMRRKPYSAITYQKLKSLEASIGQLILPYLGEETLRFMPLTDFDALATGNPTKPARIYLIRNDRARSVLDRLLQQDPVNPMRLLNETIAQEMGLTFVLGTMKKLCKTYLKSEIAKRLKEVSHPPQVHHHSCDWVGGCSHTSKTKGDLQGHQQTVHGTGNPYVCQNCWETFDAPGHLTRHYQALAGLYCLEQLRQKRSAGTYIEHFRTLIG